MAVSSHLLSPFPLTEDCVRTGGQKIILRVKGTTYNNVTGSKPLTLTLRLWFRDFVYVSFLYVSNPKLFLEDEILLTLYIQG